MPTLKCRLLGLETCTSRGVKNDDFSMFRFLETLEGAFISCLGCTLEVF